MKDSARRYDTSESERLFEKAQSLMPGGVSHDGRHPVYIERAVGSRKWDVDGNEYVDYSMGSAALLLGHAHPDVTKAITETAPRGTYFSNCHPLEMEWAALIQELVPSAERVRFVASGTEATMLALRVARAHTRTDRVLRFEGHFHGWHDYVLTGAMPPYDRPPTVGVPEDVAALSVVCATGAEKVEDALRNNDDIAAIICEVSGANWGCVPLPEGFLTDLRVLADKYGIVLIFDEVISGFRWSPGGVQALSGVTPDLTSLAKIVAGGMSGGAVVGREAFMSYLDPRHDFGAPLPGLYHRGTFNGNALVAAAGIAALKIIRTGEPNRSADALAAKLREVMSDIVTQHQVQGVVYGESSVFHVYFGATSIEGLSAKEIRGVPKQTVAAFHGGLRRRGIDLMSYLGGNTSMAHTDEDVEWTAKAFEATLQDLLAEGLIGRA